MSPAQNRLTTLEADYQKLATLDDKRVAKGKQLLQEARTLLQNIVTTTVAIGKEGNSQLALAQIEQEDSSTQLAKATRLLDQAQSALDAVKPKSQR